MIADHDDVFCYDSSILPTMNKSSRNLVPDIKIAVHPWHWAPLSVVSMMVSVGIRVHWKDLRWICFL